MRSRQKFKIGDQVQPTAAWKRDFSSLEGQYVMGVGTVESFEKNRVSVAYHELGLALTWDASFLEKTKDQYLKDFNSCLRRGI